MKRSKPEVRLIKVKRPRQFMIGSEGEVYIIDWLGPLDSLLIDLSLEYDEPVMWEEESGQAFVVGQA